MHGSAITASPSQARRLAGAGGAADSAGPIGGIPGGGRGCSHGGRSGGENPARHRGPILVGQTGMSSEPRVASAERRQGVVEVDALTGIVRSVVPACQGIEGLRRLTGGASQETWSFDVRVADGPASGLILRRAPGAAKGAAGADSRKLPLADEARLL